MNINNGKTGNVNIPGALHSTGGDGDGQVGGVVAYAGDIYDETLGKNQKEINQTLLDGSADSNVIAVALNDLNEKVEEQEKVTSSGLNDLNDKTDNLTKDVEDLERVTSSSLNDLDEKVDDLNEKVDNNEKTTASALADLDEKTNTNEKAVSAALNDLNDKIDNAAQSASDVSFDDSVTHLGTEENPITNVQAALNAAVTGFASNQSILIIKVVEYNGNPLNNIECTIGYTLNGESESFTETTNSDGYLYATLPYGAVYTVNYPTRVNRQTPASSTGIADSIHVNIFAVYSFSSDYEILHLQILLRGASTNLYPLTNATVNIDFLASDGTVTIPDARVCTIGANGRIASCVDNNGVTYNICTIPRNQKYKIKLSAWTDFDKTDDLIYTAENEVRDVLMYYIYKLSGQYLVIEDYIEGVDQDTYTEYKIINFDPVENKITIVDDEDVQWDVVKNESTGNVVRSIAGADSYSLWIPSANFNRVLGIGIRTTDLMNLQQSSIGVDDVPSKFKDSCFIVTNETITGFAFETSNDIWAGHPRSNSGLLNTKAMAYCETYTYPLSKAYFGLQDSSNARTKKFGQYTLQGFMCSPIQARAIYASQTVLKIVGAIFSLTNITNFTYDLFGASFDVGYNGSGNNIWSLYNGSGPNYSPAWAKSMTNYKHLVIYPF